MTDREMLLYDFARALDASRMADEEQQAADEAVGTPSAAAQRHWDASSLLRRLGEELVNRADQHVFAAKRMDRAAQEERRTGVEYCLPRPAA
jgi:hypothetical protein